MNINPNDPAFPDPMRGAEPCFSNQAPHELPVGMSIRTQISAGAMRGILASYNDPERWIDPQVLAVNSVAYADALIAELNKS